MLTLLLVLGTAAPPPSPQLAMATPCRADEDHVPLAGRPSPLDSVGIQLNGKAVKVCYGRPSLRGRTMLGGQIPYGKLWRTGANEPTVIHTEIPLRIAGVEVQPGSYSLYTIPGETEWTVIVNRSISQWGHENSYTEDVARQEVGRGTVPAGRLAQPVETFTITMDPPGNGRTHLNLSWDTTIVRVPLESSGR